MTTSTKTRTVVEPRGLVIHKLADGGVEIGRFDMSSGQPRFVADPPARAIIPTSTIEAAKREGWATTSGDNVKTAPGGPADDPWRVTHTFVQTARITFQTIHGPLVYVVTRQPDKYDAAGKPTQQTGDPTTSVEWSYLTELEG